jgi:RTX calcium-binding nonapeptide repeat (4 copies)
VVDAATLADGGWVFVWEGRSNTGTSDIYAQVYSPLGIAGPEMLLGTADEGFNTDVSVTALADGSFAATWQRFLPTPDQELVLWRNGVETIVSALGTAEDPSVALLPDGRLIVTWGSLNNTTVERDVFAAFVNPDGSVTAPFLVNTGTVELNQTDPQIGVFDDGRFVIVWVAGPFNNGGHTLQGQVFEPDGTRASSYLEHAVQRVRGNADEQVAVTVLNDTDFVVTWASYAGPDTILGALFTVRPGVEFVGTPGPDTFSGTRADDNIAGLAGNDYLIGDAGDDTLDGGSGDDRIDGGAGADMMFGGDGNDVLFGGPGADRMEGGPGNDTYFVDNGDDLVIERPGEGRDVVYSSVDYTLASGSHVEAVLANTPNPTTGINLTGNELAQELWGNDGVNILSGGGGNDTLIGFGGDDIYFVGNREVVIVEGENAGRDIVYASTSYALTHGQEIEALLARDLAGTTAINLTGNELSQESGEMPVPIVSTAAAATTR